FFFFSFFFLMFRHPSRSTLFPYTTLFRSVDGLIDGVSCFLLGGRAWSVFQVVHKDRSVIVEPAPRGKQPTWGGFLPQFLGFHLRSEERRVGKECRSQLATDH